MRILQLSGHSSLLGWNVYPVIAEDGSPQEAPVLQVTIVAPVVTTETHALAEELRRDSLHVEVSSADVLRETATSRVYVFCCDASLAVVLADRIVEWGGGRAGLIGVIADGGGHEREALLAAGFDDVIGGRLSARELSRACARGTSPHQLERPAKRPTPVRHVHARHHEPRTMDVGPHDLADLDRARGHAGAHERARPALSRTDLLDAVWGGGDLEVSERAVDNVILRLRRKLPQPESIETVRGVGFRLT